LGLFPKAPEYDVPKSTTPKKDVRAQFQATLSEDEQQVNLRVHIPGLLSFEGNVPTARLLLALCQAWPFVANAACSADGVAPNPEEDTNPDKMT